MSMKLLHQIKAQQFYTDSDLYQQCWVLQKIEEFKDLSRPLSDFPVLFKADFIFNDFSRKPSQFKCFSSLCVQFDIFKRIVWALTDDSHEKYQFIIFEKAAKFEIVLFCKLYIGGALIFITF